MRIPIYAVVQHSAARTQHLEFERAVEAVRVSEKEASVIERLGGVVFRGSDAYSDSDAFCEAANYPPGYDGLIPAVRGSFTQVTTYGHRIYIPVRTIVH